MLKSKLFFFIRNISFFVLFFIYILNVDRLSKINFVGYYGLSLALFTFLMRQWYLVSKQVEYRLKIYVRANSSMDRLLARILLGASLIALYCSFLTSLPESIQLYVYFIGWAVWGVFMSWPTRRKIFESKISGDFTEFKFLDGFERVTLFLIVLTFLVSFPSVPIFRGFDATKVYIDPLEVLHSQIWPIIKLSYLPTRDFEGNFNYLIYFHFYFFFMSTSLVALYCILRHFFSRRLALLGVYSFVSTWSFSIFLEEKFSSVFLTFSVLLFLWILLWSIRSSSYRSGFLTGFALYFLSIVNVRHFFLYSIFFLFIYFNLKGTKSQWYIKQNFKYVILGSLFACLLVFSHHNEPIPKGLNDIVDVFYQYWKILSRKGYFMISLLGAVLIFNAHRMKKKLLAEQVSKAWASAVVALVLVFTWITLFDPNYDVSFGFIGILAFLALVPIDLIFEKLAIRKSRRDLIFMIYVLSCLLDSHFEGRVKILINNMLS